MPVSCTSQCTLVSLSLHANTFNSNEHAPSNYIAAAHRNGEYRPFGIEQRRRLPGPDRTCRSSAFQHVLPSAPMNQLAISPIIEGENTFPALGPIEAPAASLQKAVASIE
jgi:hypothetical protein